jgi:hypothetical protein
VQVQVQVQQALMSGCQGDQLRFVIPIHLSGQGQGQGQVQVQVQVQVHAQVCTRVIAGLSVRSCLSLVSVRRRGDAAVWLSFWWSIILPMFEHAIATKGLSSSNRKVPRRKVSRGSAEQPESERVCVWP